MLAGKATLSAVQKQQISSISLATFPFGATPTIPRLTSMIIGVVHPLRLKAPLLKDVSITALLAQSFEIPTGFVSFSSEQTVIP